MHFVFIYVVQFAIPRLLGFDEMFAGAPDIREINPAGSAGTDQRPF